MGEVNYTEAAASRRILCYNRKGCKQRAGPRFIAVRSSSPYIDKISCIFHVFSVPLALNNVQVDILLFV